jgi:hypothetical protein
MADLQLLATYPVYWIILNVIPYTYPAIVGFLVAAAMPERLWQQKERTTNKDKTKWRFDLGLSHRIPYHIQYLLSYISVNYYRTSPDGLVFSAS